MHILIHTSHYKEYQQRDIPEEFNRSEDEIKNDKKMALEIEGKSSDEIREIILNALFQYFIPH